MTRYIVTAIQDKDVINGRVGGLVFHREAESATHAISQVAMPSAAGVRAAIRHLREKGLIAPDWQDGPEYDAINQAIRIALDHGQVDHSG